jgi:hypothetical protein
VFFSLLTELFDGNGRTPPALAFYHPHSTPCAPDQLFCQSATFRRHVTECFLMVSALSSWISIQKQQSTSQKIIRSSSEDDESIAPAVELAPTAGGRPKNKARTTSAPPVRRRRRFDCWCGRSGTYSRRPYEAKGEDEAADVPRTLPPPDGGAASWSAAASRSANRTLECRNIKRNFLNEAMCVMATADRPNDDGQR